MYCSSLHCSVSMAIDLTSVPHPFKSDRISLRSDDRWSHLVAETHEQRIIWADKVLKLNRKDGKVHILAATARTCTCTAVLVHLLIVLYISVECEHACMSAIIQSLRIPCGISSPPPLLLFLFFSPYSFPLFLLFFHPSFLSSLPHFSLPPSSPPFPPSLPPSSRVSRWSWWSLACHSWCWTQRLWP